MGCPNIPSFICDSVRIGPQIIISLLINSNRLDKKGTGISVISFPSQLKEISLRPSAPCLALLRGAATKATGLQEKGRNLPWCRESSEQQQGGPDVRIQSARLLKSPAARCFVLRAPNML